MMYVYMLDFRPLGGLRYIGLTTNPRQRRHQHVYNARHGGVTDLHKAIRAFGMPEPRVLLTVPTDLAERAETACILAHQTYGNGGYNMTPGGTWTPQAMKISEGSIYADLTHA